MATPCLEGEYVRWTEKQRSVGRRPLKVAKVVEVDNENNTARVVPVGAQSEIIIDIAVLTQHNGFRIASEDDVKRKKKEAAEGSRCNTERAEIDPESFPSVSRLTQNMQLKLEDIPVDNSLIDERKMHDRSVNETIFEPTPAESRWFTEKDRKMIGTFANDLRVHCDPQAFCRRLRRFLYCYMAFLGPPGSGKTTMMKYTVHQIYQNFSDDEIVCMWITPGINASAYQHSGTAFLQALLRKLNQLANDPKIKVCVLCLEELMCSLNNAGHHTMDGGEIASYLEILEFKNKNLMYVVLAATTWEEFRKAQIRFTRRFTTEMILDSYGVADSFKLLQFTANQCGCVLEGCTSEWHKFLQKLSHPLKRANCLDQAVELAANEKQSGFELEAAKEMGDYMELKISDLEKQFDKFRRRLENSTSQEPGCDMTKPRKKRRT